MKYSQDILKKGKGFELGITGKIDSIPSAKAVVRIATGAWVVFSLVQFLDGISGLFSFLIVLAAIMAVFNSRIASVILLILGVFFVAISGMLAIPIVYQGRLLELHTLFLILIIFWLQYRALRATFFIQNADPEIDIHSIQDVFE